ncbi:transcriptional regulator domain-containing protein [Xanthobacter agilis]|uniref:transcriptional regulator domain-containing protein n=1 Tax=Xanthobacter agilis TaxID=47492 RepID=UPI00372C147A
MPSSDWRAPAAYGHAHSIPAAGFAWEYLRRDDEYRRDFHRLKRKSRHDTEAQTAFSNRWGLRFRGGPGPPRRSRRALLDTRASA